MPDKEEPYWLSYSFDDALEFYQELVDEAKKQSDEHVRCLMKYLGEHDHFYLLTVILRRTDAQQEWLYARCREYQRNPKGHLDLWAREHYKSTIITFAGTFADIIADSNSSTGIFSHTRPLAKAFLRQIKTEMEQNPLLPWIWPEIFYKKPQSESPKWNEDEGICVKRNRVQNEQTVEAWGLVDGQPTSKHYRHLRYDDVVVRETVTTPEQIQKTIVAWEQSQSLGQSIGGDTSYVGTRWHLFDPYAEMIKRGSVIARLHPCTDDGTEFGNPVFMPREILREKRKNQGPYTFASQMLLNPVADKAMGFKQEWIVHASVAEKQAMVGLNRYLIVDPGGSKKRPDNDYTSMWVIGAGADKKYYALDMIRDRLNLGERTRTLIDLHRKWQPKAVGYEEYGKDSDIEHIEHVQAQELYRFDIIPLGGRLSKPDRIKRLIPIFEQKRFILPKVMVKKDYTGAMVDLVRIFLEEEYNAFPVLVHDDMLDCAARILEEELMVTFPDPSKVVSAQGYDYHELEEAKQGIDWMVQ